MRSARGGYGGGGDHSAKRAAHNLSVPLQRSRTFDTAANSNTYGGHSQPSASPYSHHGGGGSEDPSAYASDASGPQPQFTRSSSMPLQQAELTASRLASLRPAQVAVADAQYTTDGSVYGDGGADTSPSCSHCNPPASTPNKDRSPSEAVRALAHTPSYVHNHESAVLAPSSKYVLIASSRCAVCHCRCSHYVVITIAPQTQERR